MLAALVRTSRKLPLGLWLAPCQARHFGRTVMDADEFSKYEARKKVEEKAGEPAEPRVWQKKLTKTKILKIEKEKKKAASEFDLPVSYLEITYARSSGPGGQNVNKVNSKAILRMNVQSMDDFGKGTAERFRLKFGHCVTKEDQVIVSCQESRDQELNRDLAIRKLKMMILEAKETPKEQLVDFYEESLEAKKKRIDDKRRRSEIKRNSKDGNW